MPDPIDRPKLAVVGSLSIDAVLTEDGRPIVGKVGGNALWSSLGALMAGIAPRIITVVGNDYPQNVLKTLAEAGIDTSAVRRIDRSHPVRVTFAHLPDGSRLQPVPAEMLASLPSADRAAFIDTTLQPDVLPLGAPSEADVPHSWIDEIDHWHLPLLPLQRHRGLVRRISAGKGILQTDCPARSDLRTDVYGRLSATLGNIDVFLPSTSDFDVVSPGEKFHDILENLSVHGARAVLLKAGADGVYVFHDSKLHHVPAYDVKAIDPTGAGDTFCGGFMAGLALTGDILQAAALGSSAASFAIATEEPLTLIDVDRSLLRARANELQAATRQIDHKTSAGRHHMAAAFQGGMTIKGRT